MNRIFICALCALAVIALTACGAPKAPVSAGSVTETAPAEAIQEEAEMPMLTVSINGKPVPVIWEDNESVAALRELSQSAPITVNMSMYGGFEQVGSLGTRLPRNDVQTTTQAGDIVLYSGNRIVIFYGSNSWAYTRLGRVDGVTSEELAALLGNGDVTLTIEYK